MITNPMWPNPSTKYVFVKAATNGKEIAVHLEYNDPTRNDIMVTSQQYKDQAAIMFPVNQSGEEPPFTMGGDGERVNIWQWKATWDNEGKTSTACRTWKISMHTWQWVLLATTCMSLMGSYLVSVLVARDQVVLRWQPVDTFPWLVREQVTLQACYQH